MDNKIKDTVIPCPECGSTGLFTCTNCNHEVRLSMKWNGKKKKQENNSKKIKNEVRKKDYISPDEFDAIEDLISELSIDMPDDNKEGEKEKLKIKDEDVQEEKLDKKEDGESQETTARQQQALIDEIRTSLLKDIKNSITETVGIMKKELMEELKSIKKKEEPVLKTEKSKKDKPKKVSNGTGDEKKTEKSAGKVSDNVSGKDKKEKTREIKKPEGITTELMNEEPEKEAEEPEQGYPWNKTVDII